MRRIGDAVLPRRMGTDYRWLVTSSWTTNLGDGIALAAGPLLVDSPTGPPRSRDRMRRRPSVSVT